MIEHVEYGNSKIEFRVTRSKRKTLGISVLPDGKVEVTAPESATLDKIKELIIKRASWLLEQQRLAGFNPIPQPSKTLVSGESFYLLGRHYRLKVFESNYDAVSILDDRLILNCTFPEDLDFKKSILLKWYLKKAIDILTERFQFHVQKLNQETVKVLIKKLSKRWGEYHANKNLVVLNTELIVAPMECIDYVIIHELCHAVVLNHGPEFYNLLNYRLPQWKHLKNELERHSLGFSLFEFDAMPPH